MDFPHDISVDSINHSVYVGDLLAHAAWKLQMVSVNLTGIKITRITILIFFLNH